MRRYSMLGMIVLATPAAAVDVDPFAPSSSMAHGSGTPSTESPALANGGLSGGLTSTLSRDLVGYRFDDGRSLSLAPHAFNLALYGGWTFEDRLRIELVAPVYAHAQTATTLDSFSGPALGDALVQANVRLFQNNSGTFGASVIPTLGLPTGPRNALLGRGGHGRLRSAVGGEIAERFGYVANVGFTLSPGARFENVAVGSSVDGALGAWVHLDRSLRVGGDIEHRIGVSSAPGMRNTIGWASAFAQVMSDEGLGLSVSAGKGTYQGVGAPQWRVQAAITFSPKTRDSDGDGIPDRYDLCPLDPEDYDGFEDDDGCPEYDNDGDTFLDVDDLCPNEPEDWDGFMDYDGCPEYDNDQDGIPDELDACPNTPGTDDQMGCPDTDGDGVTDPMDQCPLDPGPAELLGCPDSDGDGVPDWRDACPDTPRSEGEPAETSTGCPTRAYVEGDQIRITEKVLFQTGRATVRPESFPLLDDIVATLDRYPQIRMVEVAGHTDSKGGAAMNKRLSDQRAAAVKQYLLNKGVDRDRLTSAGYGLEQPIDTNMTEIGRERNRRVEFRILEQDSITEEIEVGLGPDVAGLSVKLPSKRPFVKVELDGELVSPRAPFRGMIVKPGTYQVRVQHELMGLDYTTSVTVEGGETAIVRVPDSEIKNHDISLPTGPVPEGSPLALPKGVWSGREVLQRPEGVERRESGPAVSPSVPADRKDPATAPTSPPPLLPESDKPDRSDKRGRNKNAGEQEGGDSGSDTESPWSVPPPPPTDGAPSTEPDPSQEGPSVWGSDD